MTPRRRHQLLAAVVLGLFLWTGLEAWSLERLAQHNDTLLAIQASGDASDVAPSVRQSDLTIRASSLPLRLASINRLARLGHHQEAERAYARLIRDSESHAISLDARFNLANLYLRQVIETEANDPNDEARANAAWVELAKQGYRDLLRLDPGYWPARYNLERALRLIPETDDRAVESGDPINRVNVVVPDFETRDLP